MSLYTVLTTVSVVLTIAVSATLLGLTASIKAWISTHKYSTYLLTNYSGQNTLFWLPYATVTRGNDLSLSVGVIGVIYGLCIIGAFLTSGRSVEVNVTGRKAPRRITWVAISLVLSIFLFLLAIASLVLNFVDDSIYDFQMTLCKASQVSSGVCYGDDLVKAPLRTWICESADAYADFPGVLISNQDELRSICTRTTVALYWTIPMLLMPVFVIAFNLLEYRRRNIEKYRSRNEKHHPSIDSNLTERTATDRPGNGTGTSSLEKTKLEMLGNPVNETGMGHEQGAELPGMQKQELPGNLRHQERSELPGA